MKVFFLFRMYWGSKLDILDLFFGCWLFDIECDGVAVEFWAFDDY